MLLAMPAPPKPAVNALILIRVRIQPQAATMPVFAEWAPGRLRKVA